MINAKKDYLINILHGYSPRWFVLLIDILVLSSFVVSYTLLMKQGETILISPMLLESAIVSCVFIGFKPYRSIIRRTELHDLKSIGNRVAVTFILTVLTSYLGKLIASEDLEKKYYFSHTQLLFHTLVTGIAMVSIRLFYKIVCHSFFWNKRQNAVLIILFCAGNLIYNRHNLLQLSSLNRYKIVADMGYNQIHIGRYIQGICIHSFDELSLLERFGRTQEFVIATDNSSLERQKSITEILLMKIKFIPNPSAFGDGNVAMQQFCSIKMSGLLGRGSRSSDDINIKIMGVSPDAKI